DLVEVYQDFPCRRSRSFQYDEISHISPLWFRYVTVWPRALLYMILRPADTTTDPSWKRCADIPWRQERKARADSCRSSLIDRIHDVLRRRLLDHVASSGDSVQFA